MLFAVLGVILFFYEALRRWIKPFVIAVPCILIGIVVYKDLWDGDLTLGHFGNYGADSGGCADSFSRQTVG